MKRIVLDQGLPTTAARIRALENSGREGRLRRGCGQRGWPKFVAGGTRHAVSDFVNVPAVRDASHAHHLVVVIDNVHNAVITDSNAPEILVAVQFLAAVRSWIGGQAIDLRRQPRDKVVAQVLQLFPGGRLDFNGISSHAGVHA